MDLDYKLRRVPTAALKEELARRERNRQEKLDKAAPFVGCDTCANYRHVPPNEPKCALKHVMRFRFPDDLDWMHAHLWGFHKPRCRDYQAVTAAKVQIVVERPRLAIIDA